MNDRDKWVMLYDFYGELFNERQREYFEEYYFQNLSLSEIADNFDVSRNAIHKVIRGVEEKLNFYEEKLELYKKNEIIYDIMEKIEDENIKKMLEDLI